MGDNGEAMEHELTLILEQIQRECSGTVFTEDLDGHRLRARLVMLRAKLHYYAPYPLWIATRRG